MQDLYRPLKRSQDHSTGATAEPSWSAAPVPVASYPIERDIPVPGGFAGYARMLWLRKWILFGTALGCGLIGLLAARLQTPLYQARTSLEIQGINEDFLNMRTLDPGSRGSSPEYYVETQVRLLKDEGLLERVITRLKLAGKSEFAGSVSRAGDAVPALDRAVAVASDNLHVKASTQSRIVELLYDSPNPQTAADFANTLSAEFIERSLEDRWRSAQETEQWLTGKLDDVRLKLETSSSNLQSFLQGSGLTISEENRMSVAEERLRQFQEDLSRSQSDRLAKQSRYEAAKSQPPESLPEVLDSAPLREYQMKLAELRRQLAELSTNFLPSYYKVKMVKAQIAELESVFQRERGNVLERVRNDYDSARRREELVNAAFLKQSRLVSDQTAKSLRYQTLKREMESNRGQYESMLQRVREAGMASAIRTSNIRVITPARRPAWPYKPQPLLHSLMGAFAGLFFSLVAVLVKEHGDRRLHVPGEASLCLNLPELGAIPSVKASTLLLPSARQAPALGALRSRASSQEFESFRDAVASILLTNNDGEAPRVITVTSPSAGDGKSTLVSNLGIAIADTNRKVLLIDGDMIKPRLHSIFSTSNVWGLGDILRDDLPVERYEAGEIVVPTRIPGLDVLPCGSSRVNLSDVRYAERLSELLWRWRIEYHVVLIDTPPAMQLADARLFGRVSDGVILVLRAAQTTREEAIAAHRRFREDRTPVLGCILNDWNPKHFRYKSYA